MVLEGDEGERKTRVAVEPELERDVEHLGAATTGIAVGAGARAGRDTGVLSTDHRIELPGRVVISREGLPEIEPLTVVAVNDLPTNLHLNLLEERIAKAALVPRGPDNVRGIGIRRTLRQQLLSSVHQRQQGRFLAFRMG